jgi:hypothetical protein
VNQDGNVTVEDLLLILGAFVVLVPEIVERQPNSVFVRYLID